MSGANEQMLRRFDQAAERQSAAMATLARQAALGTPAEHAEARWLIWELGERAGVRPASIHALYLARGRGEIPAFTTSAINQFHAVPRPVPVAAPNDVEAGE